MPMVISPRGTRFLAVESRAAGFTKRVPAHEETAAKAATAESRVVYTRWLGKRPLAPPRRGRPTTQGGFPEMVNWNRNGTGGVTFDSGYLHTAAPYYLIQEIGTGESARILNPPGQVSVRSQRGRTIAMSLYWGDAEGSVPYRPQNGKQRKSGNIGFQQLYLASSLPDGAAKPTNRTGTIRREIKGKHYIRDGGREGFAVLRNELINDARSTFR